MFKHGIYLAVVLIITVLKINIFAAVPVAVMPFEGDSATSDVQVKIKEALGRSNGLTVVADKMMADIVKIHEKAQVMGSSSHDMSKIKVAEFLITGNVSGGKLTLKAVAVNEGTEVYNQTINIEGESGKRLVAKAVKEMSDKILFQSSSKGDEIPSEAIPYMNLINQLAGSLGGGDEASYKYIAIYSKGAYVHPESKNKKAVDSAKRYLKLMRQDLLRAKLYFISIKSESFWTYIEVVAEKGANKNKFKFGILDLDDGSMGIGIYEEAK